MAHSRAGGRSGHGTPRPEARGQAGLGGTLGWTVPGGRADRRRSPPRSPGQRRCHPAPRQKGDSGRPGRAGDRGQARFLLHELPRASHPRPALARAGPRPKRRVGGWTGRARGWVSPRGSHPLKGPVATQIISPRSHPSSGLWGSQASLCPLCPYPRVCVLRELWVPTRRSGLLSVSMSVPMLKGFSLCPLPHLPTSLSGFHIPGEAPPQATLTLTPVHGSFGVPRQDTTGWVSVRVSKGPVKQLLG